MNIFNQIRANKPRKNVFDLSHEMKLSMDMGKLVPFVCQEVVPGDKFRVNTEIMMRLAPMIAPVMHRVNVFTHYFFVPNRLLWNSWEDFITGGKDGTLNPVYPTINLSAAATAGLLEVGSLADYFGIPPMASYTGDTNISALPFRAYQLIYNEYYRDQNLSDPVDFSLESGNILDAEELTDLMFLRNRCWEKDYFTSALPFAQRGGDVNLPLSGGTADVYVDELDSTHSPVFRNRTGGTVTGGSPTLAQGTTTTVALNDSNNQDLAYDPDGTLKVDLDEATSVTINDLRRSARLQEWLERNARGGARYIEQILSHFGVKSSDARLQRPEYLGGGKSPVVISEVLQTSSSDDTTPQANMAGHGIAVGNSHRFARFFEEHGLIIGVLSVLPRTSYQDGIPKYFLKNDKFDFYFPEFAHLGEQEIVNAELYAQSDDPDGVFGYTPRYAEYKYVPGAVRGDFRASLNFWHLGREFSSTPPLNDEFVTADPSKRIFAVQDSGVHSLWLQIYNNIRAIRPMPKFGTPRL